MALCGETDSIANIELEFVRHCRLSDGICGSSGIVSRKLSRCLLNLSTEVKGRFLRLYGRIFQSLVADILNEW